MHRINLYFNISVWFLIFDDFKHISPVSTASKPRTDKIFLCDPHLFREISLG